MTNIYRGEISHKLNNKEYKLCLTLGALAELEDAFEGTDIVSFTERFQSGKLSANDAIKIIGAGMRGAGNKISDQEVAQMKVEYGISDYITIVSKLVNATFSLSQNDPDDHATNCKTSSKKN